MADDLYSFNERDGRRIAHTVRRVEQNPEDQTSNPQPGRRFTQPHILAKLTSVVNNLWDATEVGYDGTSLIELPDPRRWGIGQDTLGRLRPTFDDNSAAEDDIVIVFIKHDFTEGSIKDAQWYFQATTPISIGCHLEYSLEDGDLDVSVITLLGGVPPPAEDPMIKAKYLNFFDEDDEGPFPCLFIDVDCETLPPALAGWGLKIQDPIITDEPCKMMIDLNDSCAVLLLDVDGLYLDAEPMAGAGLVNLFDCELSADLGNGLDFAGNKIVVLARPSGGLDVAATGVYLDVFDLVANASPSWDGDYLAFSNTVDTLNERATFEDFLQATPFFDQNKSQGIGNQFGGIAWQEWNEGLQTNGTTIDVDYKNSIEVDGVNPDKQLQLVGDLDTPGNRYFYGTNGSGVKTFYQFTVQKVITDVQLVSNVLKVSYRDVYIYDPQSETVLGTVAGWATEVCP